MNIRNILAFALTLFAFSSQGMAQTYSIGYDQTRYEVQEGGTVSVDLVLVEEITGGETARLADGGDNGVFTFSADTNFSAFTGDAGSVFNGVASVNIDLMGDPFFTGSGQFVTEGADSVSLEGIEDFGSDPDGEIGVNGVMITPTRFELVLGTLQFDAGSVGSLTTLQSGIHVDPAANPFLFGGDTPFEPTLNFGSAQIFVVPEPGSITFIALLAGAGFLKRRRN